MSYPPRAWPCPSLLWKERSTNEPAEIAAGRRRSQRGARRQDDRRGIPDQVTHLLHLPFDILTNDKLEAARAGNSFLWRLTRHCGKLPGNEDVQKNSKPPMPV